MHYDQNVNGAASNGTSDYSKFGGGVYGDMRQNLHDQIDGGVGTANQDMARKNFLSDTITKPEKGKNISELLKEKGATFGQNRGGGGHEFIGQQKLVMDRSPDVIPQSMGTWKLRY